MIENIFQRVHHCKLNSSVALMQKPGYRIHNPESFRSNYLTCSVPWATRKDQLVYIKYWTRLIASRNSYL
jgi:hypothetical protein